MKGRVLIPLFVGLSLLVVAATFSRSGPVIPSGSLPGAEMDQAQSGAPPTAVIEAAESSSGTGFDRGPDSASAASPTPKPTAYTIPVACSEPTCGNPTPRPAIRDGIRGQATWFDVGPGLYVAIRPDLGRKGDLAIVCGGAPFHCVTAPITDVCACLGPNSNRLVDLSADLFREFAPLSDGVVSVLVQVVRRER